MIIPVSTDAPIYHRPWVTGLLIVANVCAFVVTDGGSYENKPAWQHWVLEFGNGLHPVEWILSNFLHFGFFHLLGNMIFLWGFGLVVEGKIGWWRYLLVYLGIGFSGAFLIQLIMLGYQGPSPGAGGASLAIYGLLAMSLVWAPKNEVRCAFLLFFRVFMFDVTILTFSIYYIGFELLFAWLFDFQMSSPVIHLVGAMVGFGVAAGMFKLKWVDCENWDLFAVLKGTYGNTGDLEALQVREAGRRLAMSAGSRNPNSTGSGWTEPIPGTIQAEDFEERTAKRTARQEKALGKIHRWLQSGQPRAALKEYRQVKHLFPNWQLEGRLLQALASGLYAAQCWSDAVPLMEEFITRYPARSTMMRIKLAGVAISEYRRPRYAMRLLSEIPEETLTDQLASHRRKLEQAAERMIEEGVIELDGKAWS